MLQWMVIIGKPELCQLVSSLNRFGACLREGHLDLVVRYFGYLKTTQHKQIAIDSRLIQFDRISSNFRRPIPDFIKDYPDVKEEMVPIFHTIWTSDAINIPSGF